MTISQMLSQSGLLTLLGMGVVFAFLIIMILGMNLLHFIVHAFKLDKDVKKDLKVQNKVQVAPCKTVAPAQNIDNNSVIAAIAAAVYEKESK